MMRGIKHNCLYEFQGEIVIDFIADTSWLEKFESSKYKKSIVWLCY